MQMEPMHTSDWFSFMLQQYHLFFSVMEKTSSVANSIFTENLQYLYETPRESFGKYPLRTFSLAFLLLLKYSFSVSFPYGYFPDSKDWLWDLYIILLI